MLLKWTVYEYLKSPDTRTLIICSNTRMEQRKCIKDSTTEWSARMHCNQALYGYQTNVLIESIDNRISTIRARVQSTFWNSEEGGGVVSRVIESVSIPADRLALIYLFVLCLSWHERMKKALQITACPFTLHRLKTILLPKSNHKFNSMWSKSKLRNVLILYI